MIQLGLFGEQPERPSSKRTNIPSLDRFQGAFLCSTIGDALGWPTEFFNPSGKRKPPFKMPVESFVAWKKVIGGKWWGYEEELLPGAYSDDTQLALAIARCITEDGTFEPERFAYEELPLWLHYEQGGGKSVKTAARRLIGKTADWRRNFFKQGDLDYRSAGANGAAMRNLPIALVNVGDEEKLVTESFRNSIITHGHPRAIFGAILFSLAVNYALILTDQLSRTEMLDYLHHGLEKMGDFIGKDQLIVTWFHNWDQGKSSTEPSLRQLFSQTRQEAFLNLQKIEECIELEPESYYTAVGALDPSTKGSGLGTVCAAIYMFLKYADQPTKAFIKTANMLGSDTDTIGLFLGALLGAYHGLAAAPTHLLANIQDRDYLLKTASRLHVIASGERRDYWEKSETVQKNEAYIRMMGWEIGLHELFWDEIGEGGTIFHPTLGEGKITKKVQRPIAREGYVAKLIPVDFACGQSCVFHSRVENNEKVSESLAQEITKALL